MRQKRPASSTNGMMPPQAVELEEAVLAAVMLESDAINSVISILSIESFYKDAHGLIYGAILDLFGANEPIDLLTVTRKLHSTGKLENAGGSSYVTDLTFNVASSANIEVHARIIAEMHIKREIIRLSGESIRDAYDDTTDALEILGELENRVTSINAGITSTSVKTAYSLFTQVTDEIKAAGKTETGLTGIPSGIECVDRLTRGWQNTDLIIIAARPAMGKTDLALNLACSAAKAGYPTAVFSLEMGDTQLVKRSIAIDCKISREKIKDGTLTDADWKKLSLADYKTFSNLMIADEPSISVFGLRSKLRRLKQKHGIKLCIIDYLQLITSHIKGNRNEQISDISRTLKIIAKELNMPIIALSQLSRSVETRGGDKRPMLSDLRDSGAIEQDADIVMFPFRPIYYEIKEREDIGDTTQLMEIHFAKHRNGSVDTVDCRYLGQYGRVIDFKYHDIEPPLEPIQSLPDDRYAHAFRSNTPTDF